ncbi:MAG: tetratricopeptide repeat protein [Planctomycetes bacterium]|nr:tetratricopeptide repeat protein [Planctomycetota bacterium]
MPSTVNGIGTHYYGRRNERSRQGRCRHCQQNGQLTSYDTRLFAVVFFIPVIPLGRKRIIDYCGSCSRHYVLSARQWEVNGQLNISDAMSRFHNDPSLETALGAHAQMLSFFQYDEAAGLRREALQKLPEDGELRASLAEQLFAFDMHDEAAGLYAEAVKMRPDLPVARAGHARYLLEQGKLDEARELLDFMMVPGAAQIYPLQPLLVLIAELQRTGRHEEALELVPHVVEELPHLKDDHWFRKIVKAAERGAGRSESLLPQKSFSLTSLLFSNSRDYSSNLRGWIRVTVVVALLVLLAAGYNEWIRHSRKLHILNATGVPAQIQIDGGAPVTIDAQGVVKVTEGAHTIQIRGPIAATENVTVSSGYFERWFKRPVWMLNVNGEALVIESVIQYAVNPTPTVPQFHMGDTFLSFDDVDYLFEEEPPQSISVKHNQSVTKRHLDVAVVPAEVVISRFKDQNAYGALKLAERLLSRTHDSQVLDQYVTLATKNNAADRAAKFLEPGLGQRPIDVDWHRHYQDVKDRAASFGALVQEYQQLTEKEPDSAAAWYLLARKAGDETQCERALTRALELDPKFGWALIMRGNRALQRHDWDAAYRDLAAAAETVDADDRWKTGPALVLLLQQKTEESFAELSKIEDTPAVKGFSMLLQAWAAQRQNHPVDRQKVINEVLGPAAAAPEAAGARAQLELALAYLAADWNAVRQLQQNPTQQATPLAKRNAMLLNDLVQKGELARVFPHPGIGLTEWDDLLAVALAFELSGNHETATAWMNQGIERLKSGDHDDRRLADLLVGPEAPGIAAARSIYTNPVGERSLAFAALAWKFPAQRDAFLAESQLWQILPIPHFWVVDAYLKSQGLAVP